MFSCVINKSTLFSHSKFPISLNNFQGCISLLTPESNFSTYSNLFKKSDEKNSKWLSYNDVVYPPQEPGEERRPAVCLMFIHI